MDIGTDMAMVTAMDTEDMGVTALMGRRIMRREMNKTFAVIGAAAAVLLAAVLVISLWIGRRQQTETPGEEQGGTVRLEFENEALHYDGTGALNLMEGVRAVDADGSDVTDQVTAVVSAGDNITEKRIRYSVFSGDGEETVGYRQLILENYMGPTIETADTLSLEAEELADPAVHLSESGQMTVQDGFGKDAADQVTWIREKTAPGTYDITFTYVNQFSDTAERYVNQFSDTAERTVPVSVNGETEDLTITLLTEEAVIPLGSEFDPEDYLEISDPTGSAGSVQVTGEVDTEREGRYSVYYTVISSDRTQRAGVLLKVEVARRQGMR